MSNRPRLRAPGAGIARPIDSIPMQIACDLSEDEEGRALVRMHIGCARSNTVLAMTEAEARQTAKVLGPALIACADEIRKNTSPIVIATDLPK